MKKIIFPLLTLLLPLFSAAQNYNPFVAQGVISPSPLYDVASGGSGQVSFLIGNSGDDDMPLIPNQEMLLVISLSRGIPNNVNPISAIGGSFASHFNWMYDGVTKTYLGTQNQTIPGALNGGVGNITISYQVTNNSQPLSPQNGFNVNVTPPPYTNGVNSLNDDQVSSYTWVESKFITQPDVNVSILNTPLTGNLHTNDVVLTGTTYSNPVANPGNPSSCIPTVASNGSFTFSCNTIGEYNFLVSVCEPSPSTRCTTVPLSITVIDTALLTNAPIANHDIASVYQGSYMIVNVLANDKCINGSGCTLNNPTIVTGPSAAGATVVVNSSGTITYNAPANFVGRDSVKYNVCDNQSPNAKCDAEWIYITVLAPGNPNSTLANDDFAKVYINTATNGNVLANDLDPEEDVQTVTAQNITIAGKGTFVLSSNGAFTFTPVTNFAGSVDIPYSVCDNAAAQACAMATVHVLVSFKTASTLPVTLSHFSAEALHCDAQLTWGTSQEENAASFNVLRKDVIDQNYEVIANIKAAGTSSTPKEYTYTDASLSNGKFEYKIESVDIDGKTAMSDSKLVSINCNQNIKVYPNPAVDYINVNINSLSKTKYSIKLSDLSGNTITETETVAEKGSKTVVIPVAHVASGVYNVVVSGNNDVQTFKVRISN